MRLIVLGRAEKIAKKEAVQKVLKVRLHHTLWQTFRVCQS